MKSVKFSFTSSSKYCVAKLVGYLGVSRELSQQRQNTAAARYCGKLSRIFLAARLQGPSRVVVSRKEAVVSSSLSV